MLLRVPSRYRFFVTLVFWLFPLGAASGQDERFDEWFGGLASPTSLHPSVDRVAIEYTIEELLPKPSPEEVEALRRAVGNAPDHPLRSDLVVMERELVATEPPITHCTVWMLNGEWRWSRDSNRGDLKYFDSAWAGGVAWMLTDEALLLMDQSDAPTLPQRIDQQQGAMIADLSLLLNGLLASSVYYGLELNPTLDGDRWTLLATGVTPSNVMVSMDATGLWNATEGWGTVDACDYAETSPDGSTSRIEVRASDWRSLPGNRGGIAGTVVHKISNPQIEIVRTLRLVKTDEFTPDVFQSLVTPPALVGEDPVRGKLEYRQIQDARGDGLTVRNVDTDRVASGETAVAIPGTQKSRSLRQIGWVLLAMIVASLIILKVHKLRVARA